LLSRSIDSFRGESTTIKGAAMNRHLASAMLSGDGFPASARDGMMKRMPAIALGGRAIRLAGAVAVVMGAAACFPYHSTAFYPNASVSQEELLTVRPGSQEVFEVCRQWVAPLPDAAKGWCFEMAVDTALVKAGRTIAIPSAGAAPALWKLAGAPRMNVSHAARGTLRIDRVTPTRITAALDVRDDSIPGGWSVGGKRAFRRRSVP
jgi:hypothetical protein